MEFVDCFDYKADNLKIRFVPQFFMIFMKRILLYLLPLILIASCKVNAQLVSPVKYKGKYGFIDNKGNWYIKPTFDSLGIFYNGYATSYKNGKQGKINSKGKLIVEHKFDFIAGYENGLALVVLNDSINYVNLNGQLISSSYFSGGEDFSEGLAAVKLEDYKKWGYIDSIGKIIIDYQFDSPGEFKDGKAKVGIGDYELSINRNGEVLDTVKFLPIKRKYTLIGNSNSGNLGKVNINGDTIMDMHYKAFGYPQENLFWFCTNDKYGLADTTGRKVIEPIYDYLSYFSDKGLALAKKNGKYGYINKDGTVHLGFVFEDAQGFKYGLAAVKFKGKWGFIDSSGKFTIKPKFEKVASQFRPVKAKFEAMYNFENE